MKKLLILLLLLPSLTFAAPMSSGPISGGGAAGVGGMVYPIGTGITVINAGAWGTTLGVGTLTATKICTWETATGLTCTTTPAAACTGNLCATTASANALTLLGDTYAQMLGHMGAMPASLIVQAGANNVFTYTGNFSLGVTLTGNTALTFPTSGTLATTSQFPVDNSGNGPNATCKSSTGTVEACGYGTVPTISTYGTTAPGIQVIGVKSAATTGIMSVTGPAAGENRVATVPNANWTAARTDAGQTFTGVQAMTSPDVTTAITTSSTSFTAWAGATTLLTLGGTGASASAFFPSTLDATTSTTGAIRTSGGISAAKQIWSGTGFSTTKGAAVDTVLLRGGTTGAETKGWIMAGPLTEPGANITLQLPALPATGFVKWTLSGTTVTPSTQAPQSYKATAAGTAAAITAAAADLDFGTTDPVITFVAAGAYKVWAKARFLSGTDFAMATLNSITCNLRVTSGTPADVANSSADSLIPIVASAGAAYRLGSINIGPIDYTATANDTMTIRCILGAAPTAGAMTSDAAVITAVGMLQ